jgi:TonB family protein
MLSLRSIFSRQRHSRQWERMLRKLSMTVAFCSVSLWATAQTKPSAPAKKVYTYVEQMPQLPGCGGQRAISMELLKRLMQQPLSIIDLRQQYTGSAMVYFEVNSTGTVQHVKLLRATGSASVDSALVTVTKKLPRFTPGYQNGKPVTVSFTMPFSCIKPQ